jgi:hypothetical protein
MYFRMLLHCGLLQHGDTNSDVKTPPGSKTVDNIRIIYGPAVARFSCI